MSQKCFKKSGILNRMALIYRICGKIHQNVNEFDLITNQSTGRKILDNPNTQIIHSHSAELSNHLYFKLPVYNKDEFIVQRYVSVFFLCGFSSNCLPLRWFVIMPYTLAQSAVLTEF